MTNRVYDAVLNLLVEGGLDACTISAVAERARVDRSTIHRRFPDKWETIVDAFVAKSQSSIIPDDTGSFAGDLRSVLEKLAALLQTRLGAAMTVAATELRAGENQNRAIGAFDRRMDQLAPMFERAVTRGELRAEVDRELVFTSAAGPLYFRAFIAGRELDGSFIDNVVASVCWLYCSPSVAAKLSLPARIA